MLVYKYKLFKYCSDTILYKLIIAFFKRKYYKYIKDNYFKVKDLDWLYKEVPIYFERMMLPYLMRCWLFYNRIFFYDKIEIYEINISSCKKSILYFEPIPQSFVPIFFYKNSYDCYIKYPMNGLIILCKNKRKYKVFCNNEKILNKIKNIECNNFSEFIVELEYYYRKEIKLYKLYEFKEGKVFG